MVGLKKSRSDAQKAYEEAKRRVAAAIRNEQFALDLRGLKNLECVPPLDELTTVTDIYLSGTRVSDLTPLRNLTKVWKLDLRRTPVSDLSPLTNLTTLSTLDLEKTQVSDLSPIAKLSLTTLNISGSLGSGLITSS
jgi:Leucine-rich repeat (LRR) protein